MNAPRVLFLIDEVEGVAAGGTERQLFETINALTRADFHVELGILRNTGTFDPASATCPAHYLDFPKKLGSVAGLRAFWALRSWIRERRFDIVHSFFTDSNLMAPIAGKLAGAVTVGGRRNLNHWMTPGFARFQRFSNHFADVLLANSGMVKRAVCETEKAPASKIHVIYNAIDVQRFSRNEEVRRRYRSDLAVSDDHVVIGNVANLRPVKGVQDFVEAAAIAARSNPNCRFVQVGDGELRQSLEARVRELGIEDRFAFLGKRDDVPQLLSAFDIGVLTSHAEGFSNSILEYMSAGLAIVATDVGGNREALGAETGIIVPPRDVPGIAESILKLASNPALRQTSGDTAYTRVSQLFGAEKVSDSLVSFYCSLLRTKSTAK